MKEEGDGEGQNGVKERFDAAVTVIRTLPANGSFQPSREMLLRFYALYKQATEGPCATPKPAFYDVTNRAKWEAYKSVESMTAEDAMDEYVAELKKIVEMMSLTPEVSEFIDKLGSFYELVNDNNEFTVTPKLQALKLPFTTNNHNGVLKEHLPIPASSPIHTPESPLKDVLLSVSNESLATCNEEDDEGGDLDTFQDARSHSDSDEAHMKTPLVTQSQSELHASAPVQENEPRAVFPTLFPDLEKLRKRVDLLEKHATGQAKRMLAVEAKVEQLQICHAAQVKKNRLEMFRPDDSAPLENRLLRLCFHYWRLVENRFRRHPGSFALLALIWPVIIQFIIYCFRKMQQRFRAIA